VTLRSKGADLFHLGPPKTATTWIYRCLREHPQICAPERDTIHYYDLFHAKGGEWYDKHFSHQQSGQKRFDPTYSMINCPRAAKRIYADNPKARLSFVLRNPIERGFSHYWHEKKFGKITYDFEDQIGNFDLFTRWTGYGLLADDLERWASYFGKGNLMFFLYEDINTQPLGTIQSLCGFYGIDANFQPDFLNKKINVAGARQNLFYRAMNKILPAPSDLHSAPVYSALTGRGEYARGIKPETYNALLELCLPEIERLEKLLNVDLSHWKKEAPPS